MGQKISVCASSATPTGWVEIGYSTIASCGTTTGPYNNQKAIQNVTDTPAGGTFSACAAGRGLGRVQTDQ